MTTTATDPEAELKALNADAKGLDLLTLEKIKAAPFDNPRVLDNKQGATVDMYHRKSAVGARPEEMYYIQFGMHMSCVGHRAVITCVAVCTAYFDASFEVIFVLNFDSGKQLEMAVIGRPSSRPVAKLREQPGHPPRFDADEVEGEFKECAWALLTEDEKQAHRARETEMKKEEKKTIGKKRGHEEVKEEKKTKKAKEEKKEKKKKKPRDEDVRHIRLPDRRARITRERIPFECAACGEEVRPSKGYLRCACEREFCLDCGAACDKCGRSARWLQATSTMEETRRGPAPWVVH